MKKTFTLAIALCGFALAPCEINAEPVIVTAFNSANVILPSSEYTPADRYTAQVWVYNTGTRYEDQYYNHVFATPEPDADGRQWFEPEYQLTPGQEIEWQEATAPFSSDEYYKDQPAFRWVTSDIMGDIYMRRAFTLSELPAEDIYLSCGHDDAPSEWYINGVQVHTVSDGWNNGEYKLLTAEQKALLKDDGSENIIAVHVHQNWGGAFADCGLYKADMTQNDIILTTRHETPTWECEYFFPIDNEDLNYYTEEDIWYSPDFVFPMPESEWISGVGPFSDEVEKYGGTYWDSSNVPILIRRYFTLTAENMAAIQNGTDVVIKCSYDEYPKLYINGNFVWSADGWNNDDFANVVLTDEQKEFLHEGENMLAISLQQGGGSGHVDLGMNLASKYVPGQVGITAPETDRLMPQINDNRIFDLCGRYMGTETDNLPRGIYVRNGKKLILGK